MANEYNFSVPNTNSLYETQFGTYGAFQVGNDDPLYTNIDGAIRFTGITIAQGATIVEADIKIYESIVGGGAGSLNYDVYGIDEDNTAEFTSNPFSRSSTTATYNYQRSLTQGQTFGSNVTNIVQEIVNRGGWSSGNAMGFKFLNHSSPADVYVFTSNSSLNYGSYLIFK